MPEKQTRNISVTLGEYFNDFADQQVKRGNYASTSEVVRAGLRLLAKYEEERELKLKALREACRAGEESGFIRYDSFDQFMRDVMPADSQKK